MQDASPNPFIPWILWFAYLQATFVVVYLLRDFFTREGEPATGLILFVAIVSMLLFAAASFIRWRILSRPLGPSKQLVLLIVGLALSETPVFLSIFMLGGEPSAQFALLILAVLSIIQFAPTYATPGVSKHLG